MSASRIRCLSAFWAICLVVTGCCHSRVARPEDLVTSLGKLTPAVQALVRYPEDGVVPDGATALMTVFREKPELREAFAGVPVLVWQDGTNVVVAVCAPDWSGVWLEDASWSIPVDEQWFTNKTPHELKFSLKSPPAKQP